MQCLNAAIVAICQHIVDESSSWNSESASQARSLLLAILLHLVHMLFPSCMPTTNRVAGMTDDPPTQCRPVHHLARSQSSRPSFLSIVGLHVSIVFSAVPSSFSLFLSSFPWYICPKYFPQYVFFISPHHKPLPVRHPLSDLIEACATLVVPHKCSFQILPVNPYIHFSIIISFTLITFFLFLRCSQRFCPITLLV